MMPRIERQTAPARREALARRRKGFAPAADERNPELALAYSNGYVTVEISQDALDAYVDMTGDVPLPVVDDPETGDRRTYDAKNKVTVVYDAAAKLREISKRSGDGLFVRLNFTDDDEDEPEGPLDDRPPHGGEGYAESYDDDEVADDGLIHDALTAH